jgi:hypothetical protein
MRRQVAVAALLIAGTTVTIGALAARPLEKELPPKGTACFERIYDAAHLNAHPMQQVTHITLIHEPSADAKPEAEEPLYVSIEITVRGNAEIYALGGRCEPQGNGLLCAPSWEAGSFLVEPSADGTLMVTNKSMMFNPSNSAAEEVAPGALQLKGDDKAWKLFRGGPECGTADKPVSTEPVPTPR